NVKLEHGPEKWVPVFGKRSCSTKKLERGDDSKKSHLALRTRTRPRKRSILCRPSSVVRLREASMAMLVFLARAAGAGLVAADLAPAGRSGRLGNGGPGGGRRSAPVAGGRLGAGSRQRELVLAGRGIDLVRLHVRQLGGLLRRRRGPDLDPHQLRGHRLAQIG